MQSEHKTALKYLRLYREGKLNLCHDEIMTFTKIEKLIQSPFGKLRLYLFGV